MICASSGVERVELGRGRGLLGPDLGALGLELVQATGGRSTGVLGTARSDDEQAGGGDGEGTEERGDVDGFVVIEL